MNVLDIDLNKYVNVVQQRYGYASYHRERNTYPELGLRENGLRAAKDSQISKKAGDVDQIRLTLTDGIHIREVFLKALLGPTARKISPEVLIEKIAIVGNTQLLFYIQSYLKGEAKLIKLRAEKKAAEKEPLWSEDKVFFLPEIGTKLRLSEDWEFDLYPERRNDKFFPQIGLNISVWGPRREPYRVKVLRDSMLTVDRIYIRKGAKDYSSVTFYIRKGAKVEYNGGLYIMKGARFWAKLHDVNTLKVKVDITTVPGLEG